MKLTQEQYRHGLRVQAKVDGVWYNTLTFAAGRWLLENAREYTSADRAEEITIPDGRLDDLDLIDANPVYVRLGGIPDSGYSYNFADGRAESGVSCFRAAWDGDTLVVEGNAGLMLFDSDRALYLLDGELLAEQGSDDEPLLAPGATIVRELDRNKVRFAR